MKINATTAIALILLGDSPRLVRRNDASHHRLLTCRAPLESSTTSASPTKASGWRASQDDERSLNTWYQVVLIIPEQSEWCYFSQLRYTLTSRAGEPVSEQGMAIVRSRQQAMIITDAEVDSGTRKPCRQ